VLTAPSWRAERGANACRGRSRTRAERGRAPAEDGAESARSEEQTPAEDGAEACGARSERPPRTAPKRAERGASARRGRRRSVRARASARRGRSRKRAERGASARRGRRRSVRSEGERPRGRCRKRTERGGAAGGGAEARRMLGASACRWRRGSAEARRMLQTRSPTCGASTKTPRLTFEASMATDSLISIAQSPEGSLLDASNVAAPVPAATRLGFRDAAPFSSSIALRELASWRINETCRTAPGCRRRTPATRGRAPRHATQRAIQEIELGRWLHDS
jgi:hypothetical protein